MSSRGWIATGGIVAVAAVILILLLRGGDDVTTSTAPDAGHIIAPSVAPLVAPVAPTPPVQTPEAPQVPAEAPIDPPPTRHKFRPKKTRHRRALVDAGTDDASAEGRVVPPVI